MNFKQNIIELEKKVELLMEWKINTPVLHFKYL